MGRYVVLYNAPMSAREQMAAATPEQAQAGMQAWMSWAQGAGAALVDLGAPLQPVGAVGADAATQPDGDVSGYSILEADSQAAVESLLAGHPHLGMPGASIAILEVLPVPGA
jgi:hypothetical protein